MGVWFKDKTPKLLVLKLPSWVSLTLVNKKYIPDLKLSICFRLKVQVNQVQFYFGSSGGCMVQGQDSKVTGFKITFMSFPYTSQQKIHTRVKTHYVCRIQRSAIGKRWFLPSKIIHKSFCCGLMVIASNQNYWVCNSILNQIKYTFLVY